MHPGTPTFRIFVSSTFSDLKEERNALNRSVFPALERLCEERGARFQAIDLRWGVRQEAGLGHQTMRICLDEVKRCQEARTKPNFLILLGDRYGWRPLPAEIPTDEWNRIAAHLTGQGPEGVARLRRLEEWYQLDRNARTEADPPGTGAWLLKPRTQPPYNDSQKWETEVERPLRQILADATAALQLAEKARLKYGASATEQEISRGALEEDDAPQHVFCFFRAIDGLPADPTAEGFRDLIRVDPSAGQPGDLILDPAADELLARLKGASGTLRARLGRDENFFEYRAEWLPLPESLSAEEWSVLLGRLEAERNAALERVERRAELERDDAHAAEMLTRLRALIEEWYQPEPGGSARLSPRFATLDQRERIDLERRLRRAVFHEKRPPISTGHLDRLCEDVHRVLSGVILAELDRLDAEKQRDRVTELDEEIAAHERFALERLRSKQPPNRSFFTGRTAALDRIAAYVSGASPTPLALLGEPGSGKSSVMAKAVELARQTYGDERVVSRFIGWTPGSAVVRELLDSLCRQISRAYEINEATPSDYRELVQELPKRLTLASAEKPLILFLDALDQISDADNARNLVWLPTELPPSVRVVVSTSTEPDDIETVLRRRLPAENRVDLDDMDVKEADQLLGIWFDDVGRTLQGRPRSSNQPAEGQWKRVLGCFEKCPRPLFLKLAFEEARRWRSFDTEAETPLASDLQPLIRQLFGRLAARPNHGATLVSAFLGYLMAARHGLTEDEVLKVLGRDDAVLEEVKRFHQPPEEKLPVVLWSRLYFDLEPYLRQRKADETSLFAFYHRQLELVARQDYLVPVQGGRHHALADYFGPQSVYLGEAKTPNLRKLSELPYQQTHAGDMWNELHQTLTDFEFLEAKCTHIAVTTEGSGDAARKVYGGVYELQEDYRTALKAFEAS
jgi:hypothetical protein